MKKIITLLVMILMLCACSVSTSSTTTTEISTTDSNGNTTTTTTTTENGVTTTDTITSSQDDPTGLRNKWKEYFSQGGEGVSKDGYNVYLAYDNPEDIKLAAIMILNSDNSELLTYIFGDVVAEEDHFKIVDVVEDEELPFWLTDKEVEDGFEITFKDNDSVELKFVDQETIINDMIDIWEVQQDNYKENHPDLKSE